MPPAIAGLRALRVQKKKEEFVRAVFPRLPPGAIVVPPAIAGFGVGALRVQKKKEEFVRAVFPRLPPGAIVVPPAIAGCGVSALGAQDVHTLPINNWHTANLRLAVSPHHNSSSRDFSAIAPSRRWHDDCDNTIVKRRFAVLAVPCDYPDRDLLGVFA